MLKVSLAVQTLSNQMQPCLLILTGTLCASRVLFPKFFLGHYLEEPSLCAPQKLQCFWFSVKRFSLYRVESHRMKDTDVSAFSCRQMSSFTSTMYHLFSIACCYYLCKNLGSGRVISLFLGFHTSTGVLVFRDF